MELHAFEAKRTVEGELLLVGEGFADVAAEGVAAFADIPGVRKRIDT
jgi:hypothetical protein